jgi:hypothetical protein
MSILGWSHRGCVGRRDALIFIYFLKKYVGPMCPLTSAYPSLRCDYCSIKSFSYCYSQPIGIDLYCSSESREKNHSSMAIWWCEKSKSSSMR